MMSDELGVNEGSRSAFSTQHSALTLSILSIVSIVSIPSTEDSETRIVLLNARLQRLKERALADGGAARGAPGCRAYARMLAHTKYGAATWGQRRAFMLKALAEIAPLAIADDERLVGEHLFNEQTSQLDFGTVFDAAAQKQLDDTPFDAETRRQIADFLRTEQIERSGPAVHAGGDADAALGGGWGSGNV